ncbi:MAG: hypothetical protein WCF36_00025 [Candidatus Nanopelagicales bacterium]
MTTAPGRDEPMADQAGASGSPGRSIGSGICLVLALLLMLPGALAFWGHRTLTDTQRYVATVGPLVDSPEVQAAIAAKVTDAISKQVDIESLIDEAFAGVITDRPRLAKLSGPLAGAVNGLIDRQVSEFVASQTFADLWVTINTQAQQRLVSLLEGNETGAVSLQGDRVVLDLSDVIDQVQAGLVARGLTFAANVPIPEVDRQIVLMEAPSLRQARTIYAFANPIATWLIVVVFVLYLAAFLLARRRSRMTVLIGLALAADALLLGLALSVGRQLIINDLAGTIFGPASAIFYDTLLTYLQRGVRVLAWLGLILVAAGWFTGRNSTASALRSTVSGALESVGATQSGGPAHSVGRWVAANATWLRVVAGVLGVIALMWGDQATASRLAWSMLVVLGLLIAIQVLVGVGQRRQDVTNAASAPGPEPAI